MHHKKDENRHLNTETGHARKLIRIRNVTQITGLSKSYIYELCNKGLFPKSIRLVPRGTSVAWVEKEVLDWIDSRIKERDDKEVLS